MVFQVFAQMKHLAIEIANLLTTWDERKSTT